MCTYRTSGDTEHAIWRSLPHSIYITFTPTFTLTLTFTLLHEVEGGVQEAVARRPGCDRIGSHPARMLYGALCYRYVYIYYICSFSGGGVLKVAQVARVGESVLVHMYRNSSH